MKKFLTVLLVIAVMFTFSFSSAFAATTYTAADVVAAMQAEADDYCKLIEAQGTVFVKGYAGSYDKTAVQEATNEVVAEQKAAFLAEVIKLQAAVSGEFTAEQKAEKVAAVAAKYNDSAVATNVTDGKISAKQVEINVAAAKADIAKYDVTKYNDSTADADVLTLTAAQAARTLIYKEGDKVSKKAYVEAVIAYITDYVDGVEAADTKADNDQAIAGLASKMQDVASVIDPIATLEEEAEANKTAEELKAYRTSIMEGELALAEAKVRKVLNDKLADLKKATKVDTVAVAQVEEEIAALDAQYDAAKKVLTAYIAAGTPVGTSHLECTDYSGFAAVKAELNKCVDRVSDVSKFEAYAKVIAGVTDASGAKIYDAEEVEKITKDVVAKIYAGTATYADKANVDTFANAKIAGAASLAQKNEAINTIKAYKDAAKYDEAQAEELKTIVDKAVEDIMAAATKADIDKIVEAAKKSLDAVVTKAQHSLDWATTGKLGKEFVKTYQSELAGYAAYADSKLGTTGYTQAKAAIASKDTTYTNIPKFAMDIVKEAYTVDEIAGKVAEAKAAIDALKSDAEIKAAAEAVEALIAQIKVPVTADQKEVILAAKKALDEYKAIEGATTPVKNEPLLSAAVSTLASIEKAELIKKFNACPADADAIAALKAEIEAYNAYAPKNDQYNPNFSALEAKVKAAKFAEVRAALVAIPAEPTTADKPVVEAARAAYDALSLEEKIEFGADKLNALYLDKLVSAEATIAAAEVTAVETLKLKACTDPAKKGSITVRWRAYEGDITAADGFQVWRSTKHSIGYKRMFTTTKTSYKNTKNLKKGVRYYYKVRAYKVVDGKNIYSDWSNKARRIAK